MRATLPHLLCGLIGVVYPAYKVHQAVKEKDNEKAVPWLTYWIIYSMIMIPELFLDRIMYHSPLYFTYNLCKLVGLLWLVHPKIRGYNLLFLRYLERHFVLLWDEGERESVGRSVLGFLWSILQV